MSEDVPTIHTPITDSRRENHPNPDPRQRQAGHPSSLATPCVPCLYRACGHPASHPARGCHELRSVPQPAGSGKDGPPEGVLPLAQPSSTLSGEA